MIEKLLRLFADQSKLAPPEDDLSNLVKNIDNSEDEIDELMLEQIAAARLEIHHDLNDI